MRAENLDDLVNSRVGIARFGVELGILDPGCHGTPVYVEICEFLEVQLGEICVVVL